VSVPATSANIYFTS